MGLCGSGEHPLERGFPSSRCLCVGVGVTVIWLIHVKPNALSIAQSRLRIARSAVETAKNASSFDEFSDAWFIFLTAWKGIYTVLEQGSKESPKSRQWFGGKKAERKKTTLLQYLFEARNDEEHGLAKSVVPYGHTVLYQLERPSTGVEMMNFEFDESTGDYNLISSDIPVTKEQEVRGPTLVTVKDRGGKELHPPIGLPERPHDITPIGVAMAALDYATAMIDEARMLHATST